MKQFLVSLVVVGVAFLGWILASLASLLLEFRFLGADGLANKGLFLVGVLLSC